MKPYTRILKKIQKYDLIVVFRHVAPDYDALGSQFGLATFLKIFSEKKIYTLGRIILIHGKLYP